MDEQQFSELLTTMQRLEKQVTALATRIEEIHVNQLTFNDFAFRVTSLIITRVAGMKDPDAKTLIDNLAESVRNAQLSASLRTAKPPKGSRH